MTVCDLFYILNLIILALKKQAENDSYAASYNDDQDDNDSTEASVENDSSEQVLFAGFKGIYEL